MQARHSTERWQRLRSCLARPHRRHTDEALVVLLLGGGHSPSDDVAAHDHQQGDGDDDAPAALGPAEDPPAAKRRVERSRAWRGGWQCGLRRRGCGPHFGFGSSVAMGTRASDPFLCVNAST